MKKLTFSMSAFFFVSLMALADNVTPKSALQIAKDAMPRQARSLRLAGKAEGSNPAWYAFDAGRQEGGFVIVAGDDRVGRVLGYSDEGSFDAADMPADMKWWLKGCEEQIELLRQGKAQPARILTERPAVAPLVTSKWGQHAPYNLLTPEIGDTHTPTGCMPTAMAQILYYWKSKAGASAIDTYTTESEQIKMDPLPATTFNYDIMQDVYESSDESAGAHEVAKLMLYCGQSFNVDYQIGGSGASGGSSNFIKDFHFDIHGFDLRSISESREQWDEAIYAELAAGRPVFMSGVSYEVGHGFVVDGCNGHGLYHINWGWDGRHNGYYLLDVATPGDMNDTTIYGEGYSIGQIAGIGLQPASDGISYDDMALCVSSIETSEEVYTRSSADEDFSVGVWAQVNNYYGATLSFDYSAAVFTTEGELVQSGFVRTMEELPSMYGAEVLHFVDFGAGIESGSYILKVVSRLEGQETWNPDFGSYRHYVDYS